LIEARATSAHSIYQAQLEQGGLAPSLGALLGAIVRDGLGGGGSVAERAELDDLRPAEASACKMGGRALCTKRSR
jgi:hypothetical protein